MSSTSVMSLREHFSELKRRAKIVFVSFVILFLAMLAVPADPASVLAAVTGGGGTYVPLIAFFLARVKLELLPAGWTLIGLSVNAALEAYLLASLVFALIFNAPIFAYEVIMFINPGLKETERKLIYPFVGAASALFTVGVLFGFFFLAKFLLIALTPFFVAAQFQPTISGLDFYSIVFITVGMSGISFTVPVYVYTAIRLGIVKPTTFTNNRIVIWAITYIICAIVTPDGGPLLDVLLFIPIITLLELSVWLGARSVRGRQEAEEASSIGAGAPSTGPPPGPSVPAPGLPPPAAPATSTYPSIQAPKPPPRPRAQKRYCLYCLREMPPDSVFCPHCGRAGA